MALAEIEPANLVYWVLGQVQIFFATARKDTFNFQSIQQAIFPLRRSGSGSSDRHPLSGRGRKSATRCYVYYSSIFIHRTVSYEKLIEISLHKQRHFVVYCVYIAPLSDAFPFTHVYPILRRRTYVWRVEAERM